MKNLLTYLSLAIIVFAVGSVCAYAQSPLPDYRQPPPLSGNALALERLLATPEDQIDYAESKLVIDRLIDPSLNIEAARREITEMVYDVRQMAGPNADEKRLLGALRAYLYRPGPWNAQRVFGYDHDDPLGTNIRNKLIPTYLASRKGNCVSMPALFVILGQKLGLEMTLSTAPNHVFVHYHDPSGARSPGFRPSSGSRSSCG